MKHEKGDKKIVLYWNWRKIVSWILLLILIPTFGIFIISLSLKNTLANPDFYKENLAEANTYERLINDAIPSIIMDSTLTEDNKTNLLAQQGIIFVIQKAVSPDWVQEKTDSLIDKTASYFSKPENEPSITIDIDDFNSNLKTISDGLIILNEFVPTCEEAKNFESQNNSLLKISLDCESTSFNLDQLKDDISLAQKEVKNLSVEDIEIANEFESVLKEINIFKNYFFNISKVIWISLILSILFVATIILINKEKMFKAIKSTSIALSIGCLAIIIYSTIERSLTSPQISKTMDLKITYSLKVIINDIAKVSVDNFFGYLITLSAVILAILVSIDILLYILKYYKIIKIKD